MPHEVVRAPEHDRRRSLGWLASAWMHHFCIHGKGDISGAPLNPNLPGGIALSDELVGFTADCYGLDLTGRRLYESAFLSRAKGWDKSGHAGRLTLFEALGPCRFEAWAEGGEVFRQMDFEYRYEPGEPMGRPIRDPLIKVFATEETQTGNVYDVVYQNLREGPLRMLFAREEDIGLTRVYLPDGGEIRPATASSAAKDGGLESFCVFDETHLYTTPELRRMYVTVRRNLGKRMAAQPWSFEPSTMYKPGQNSIAEQSHKLAEQIRDGTARAARLLFDHREGFANTNLDDADSLRASLREAYAGADYIDIERLVTDIWDPRAARNESIQFFLNRPTSAAGRAVDLAKWDASRVEKTKPHRRRGTRITLGFDGARTRDSTFLTATNLETGFQWHIAWWERPSDAPEDWDIDEDEVDASVEDAFERYEVVLFYADTSKWEKAVARWAGLYNHSEDAQKAIVVKWPVQFHKKSAISAKAYAGAIDAGKVLHGDDTIQRQHIANTFRELQNFTDDDNTALWLPAKERPGSPNKIDGFYAGMLSWQAHVDAIAKGALNQTGPSVYESRGVLTV